MVNDDRPVGGVNLRGMDLNLLTALNALLEEGHVTRAAERVGLTQPAMSNALARLRAFLGDPILVRGAGGMVVTERAAAMRAPVQKALQEIECALFGDQGFDPSAASHTFNVGATDHVMFSLFPELCRRIEKEAPGIRLHTQRLQSRLPVDALSSGEIDLALRHLADFTEPIHMETLFLDEFVCLVWEGNARIGKRITLKQFIECDHLLVSPWGGMDGVIDQELKAHGVTRNVRVAVPDFLLAPELLVETDYVLTMARSVAEGLAARLPLRVLKHPLKLTPSPYGQFWHERTQNSAPHAWLRQIIRDIAAEVASRVG